MSCESAYSRTMRELQATIRAADLETEAYFSLASRCGQVAAAPGRPATSPPRTPGSCARSLQAARNLVAEWQAYRASIRAAQNDLLTRCRPAKSAERRAQMVPYRPKRARIAMRQRPITTGASMRRRNPEEEEGDILDDLLSTAEEHARQMAREAGERALEEALGPGAASDYEAAYDYEEYRQRPTEPEEKSGKLPRWVKKAAFFVGGSALGGVTLYYVAKA